MKTRYTTILLLSTVLGACGDDGGSSDSAGTTGADGGSVTMSGGSSGMTAGTTGMTTMNPTTGMTTMTTMPGDSSTTSDTMETGSSSSSGSGGSSSSSSSGGQAALPDIDMSVVHDEMAQSVFTQTVNFPADDCAVEEACVDAPGNRRLLRFDTITPNLGEVDFVVGSPTLNPEMFEFAPCHGHYHFVDYANYRLLDSGGGVAATGHKQAFALIDLSQWVAGSGPGKYPLADGTQGITVGWADIYSAFLDCQWVDITGVPSGDYTLEISINPEEVIEEATYANNVLTIAVTITDQDDGPQPPPPEWTCNSNFYDASDGCDCGCGALDPDCINPTAAACEYCDLNGSCADGIGCSAISANDNSICD